MLTVKQVNYSYDKKHNVLKNVNLELGSGEFLTIAGPNGSGKTTLIKLMIDLLKLQEGSIIFDGLPHDKLAVKKNII